MAKAAGVESLPDKLGLYALGDISNEPLCREFADIYGGVVYRDKKVNDSDYRRLQEIVSQLKNSDFAIQVALPNSLGDNVDS